ncbi:PREDICTED: protein MOTHER of FT and TFL1 [Ipomoea nil]|uniref:protein MOTHER of FT and TFL1 n=1 Tax=Ipomoea nil TaxID=35883 RepID=UPI000900CB99|nr:PREDICTED: protein MOTHER of FT and TFL1 [Ipomoea nil]
MMVRRNVDPLVVGRVIGDVVDMFVPTVDMAVYYGPKAITSGSDVKPSMVADRPRVHIGGDSTQFYTLVMTDPDAPSPSEPCMRELVHWIVTDIPGNTHDITKGKEAVPYMGPKPTVGIHRYILVLFQQKKVLGELQPPVTSRNNFCTRAFAHHLELDSPVATVYFNAHKEPAASRRRN